VLCAAAVTGVGVAAFHPEAARQVYLVSGERRATAMSFFAVGGNLGFAIGPALATPLQLRFGLRGTVLLVLPALAMALVLWRTGVAGALTAATPFQEASGREPDRWWAFLRLSAPVICRAIVFYGLNTFIPLYWIQSYGASKAAGATALTLMLSAGVAGTLLGGWLADRFGRRVVVLVSMLVLVPLLWEFVATPSRTLALALLVPIGLALYAPFSVMTVMGQEYLPGRVGTASGLTIGLAVTLGGLAAPLLGRISDSHGVRAALSTLVAVPVAGALATLTLPRDARLGSHRS
jgi:FSR family fosmidomycin resistance protein-like MFS transporter